MCLYKTVAVGDIAWQLFICTALYMFSHSTVIRQNIFQRCGKLHYFYFILCVCVRLLCQEETVWWKINDFVSAFAKVQAAVPP